MKYAFAGAALIAGALAVPAWGPETVEVTTVETITSCGPEVTNCPAKSTSAAWTKPTGGYGGWTDSWSTTASVSSSSSASSTSTVVISTSVSTVKSSSTTVKSSSSASTPVTTAPVVPSTSSHVWSSSSSPVAPVSSSSWTGSWTKPAPPAGTAPVPPPPAGTAPAPSGTAPGWKPSGTGYTSIPSSKPITPSTGGAAQNAAGLLAGVGAVAALFL